MMEKKMKRLYRKFRIQLRLLRLRLLFLRAPQDAKDPEQMLNEIKKELKRT